MGRMEGKVAIVTGGARGIGEAICRRYVAEGAKVIVADRRETAAEVATDLGEAARFSELDVSDANGWSSTVALATEAFGGVDVLVNNAGIMRIAPLRECDEDMFRKVIDINLVGVFLGMRAVVDAMEQRGGGSIINVCSPQGIEGRHSMPAYTASKFGVRGLSMTAAMELGEFGIRVNTLVPGAIRTPMTTRKGWTEEQYDEAYGSYPLGRMGTADEISGVAVFLASDDSTYCTGSDFVADGGILAGKPRS